MTKDNATEQEIINTFVEREILRRKVVDLEAQLQKVKDELRSATHSEHCRRDTIELIVDLAQKKLGVHNVGIGNVMEKLTEHAELFQRLKGATK